MALIPCTMHWAQQLLIKYANELMTAWLLLEGPELNGVTLVWKLTLGFTC
jgi:hypothetical protein